MPRRKIQIINGEFYHIVKRGIEGREIFLDNEDRFRLINSLLVFNDKLPTPWKTRSFWYQRDPKFLTRMDYKPRLPLVEIHSIVFMPDHFHLLVRQLMEGGIKLLMQKLGGYSYYFNKKYKREGTLFQDRYKIIHISTTEQLKNTFVYIHTNPTSLVEPEWKDWRVKNPQRVIKFLEEEYRWSSYWDFIGKQNFPTLITRNFFLNLFNGKEGIKKEINSWIYFKNKIFKDSKKLDRVAFE
jgi:putative transposase